MVLLKPIKKLFIILVSIVCLLLPDYCKSQDTENDLNEIQKNSIYFEWFGNAYKQYMLGYDRVLFAKGINKMSIASGAGMPIIKYQVLDNEFYDFLFSSQVNYFRGIDHHFEMGLGFTYLKEMTNNNYKVHLMLRIGYRYQKPEGGLFIKSGFTPYFVLKDIRDSSMSQVPPIYWGGVVIGYTF